MYRVRWPWASRSMRSPRCPSSARAAPRLTAVVVLPTPPFCMATAIVRANLGPSLAEHGGSGPPRQVENASASRKAPGVLIPLIAGPGGGALPAVVRPHYLSRRDTDPALRAIALAPVSCAA